MAFRCENCNGSVIFDIASQRMKCLHCGGEFAPESFRVRDVGAPAGNPFDTKNLRQIRA